MDLLGYLVVAFGNHWQQYIFFTLHLRKLVSAPYRSLRIPQFCQVCLFTFFPYQIELPSSPASGDTDAGLQYHTWDLEQGCTPIWVREREKKSLVGDDGHTRDSKIHIHCQENCSHTFVWTIFSSGVAVKYFEEIKWSLSKVVWTPVNHCSIANKTDWNNGIAFF